MTKKTTKISLLLLGAVLPVLLLAQIPGSSFESHAAIEIDAEYVKENFPDVNISEAQKDTFLERAKVVDGVKTFSASGWEYADIEYYGVTEPVPKFTNAVITLKLADQSRALTQCEYGLYAQVDFDIESGKIVDSIFPAADTKCEKGFELGRSQPLELPDEKESPIPDFIPQADASNYYHAATNDNTGKYGGWVFITSPTVDENDIYDDMDEYLGFTFNQDFGTGDFLQTGWLITTKAGTTGSNISADSVNMVYVDEAHWGDLQPRKMAGTTYQDNSSAILYIHCDTGDTDYQIEMWYGSTLYNRDSGVECTNTTTGAATDNSVFLENANTVTSSDWSDDITTVVKAYAADEYDTSTSTQVWQDGSAKYVNCSGSIGSTSAIDGDLENNNTAEWDAISAMGVAC